MPDSKQSGKGVSFTRVMDKGDDHTAIAFIVQFKQMFIAVLNNTF